MGKILAVWSDSKKEGKSIVTYMLARQMADNKNLKVLVCCLNLKYSSLYRLFGVEFSATGLEDIINYKLFEDFNADIIQKVLPRHGNIAFLGSYKMTNMYARRHIEKYIDLFNELKNYFDLIIIDTVSGTENALTNLVLQTADVILKLYNQDIESIRGLQLVKEEQASYHQDIIYLISKYRNIYPRVADLKRRFGLNQVYTLEYCETLQEMKNRDSLHLYLQRETACNKSIEKISVHLLKTLDLTSDNLESDSVKTKDRGGLERFFRRIAIAGRREKHENTSEVEFKRINEIY
jgi:MinD-like ATPase involved in chromosome partitioning or flagellar assembly